MQIARTKLASLRSSLRSGNRDIGARPKTVARILRITEYVSRMGKSSHTGGNRTHVRITTDAMKRHVIGCLCQALVLAGICAQEASFPLESVVIEGSQMPRETVLEITGFRLGAPVNKAAIEQGCGKLRDSGLFEDINYRYGPGPKHGYVVTLTLADQIGRIESVIDIPAT